MEKVKLGTSDLMVSPICVGCWQFNSGEQSADKTHPVQPEQVSKSIVDKAFELGINYFDTAQAYLNSEVVLGRILQGRRRDAIVASKFGGKVPQYTAVDIDQAITASLQRLQTDYIDLYQVHWPTMVADFKDCFDELERQKAKGRIREYGVCNFGPCNLKDAFALGAKPTTNQIAYNLLWRTAEDEIIPMCSEYKMSVLPYSPLQQGLLSGKYSCLDDVPEGRRRTRLFNSSSTSLSVHGTEGAEKQLFHALDNLRQVVSKEKIPMSTLALSWCLQAEPVASVIVGASSPEQLEENFKTVHLQQSVISQLNEATKELKDSFEGIHDLWAKESRIK